MTARNLPWQQDVQHYPRHRRTAGGAGAGTDGAQAVQIGLPPSGYSTLWLAGGSETAGGRVTTIELTGQTTMAATNFERAGFTPGLSSWRGGWQPVALPADAGLSAHSSTRAPPPQAGGPRSSPCLPSWPAGGGQCHLLARGQMREDGIGAALTPYFDFPGAGGRGSGWWCSLERYGKT